MKNLLILSAALHGCGIVSAVAPSTCEQLVTTVCDECNVSDYYSDVVCECVAEGEINNARQYFDSPSEAEVDCDNRKLGLERRYLSEEDSKDCAQSLNLIKEHGDDACDVLGFTANEVESDPYDYYNYYDYESEE